MYFLKVWSSTGNHLGPWSISWAWYAVSFLWPAQVRRQLQHIHFIIDRQNIAAVPVLFGLFASVLANLAKTSTKSIKKIKDVNFTKSVWRSIFDGFLEAQVNV